MPESGELRIFTVGHSSHTLDRLLSLLKLAGIEVLVDDRSYPSSKFASQFNKDDLARVLKQNGVQYLFLGDQLGGFPKSKEFYDREGHVDYLQLAESSSFRRAISRLQLGVQRFSVALMCGEENPAGCHRHLLVARVLDEKGVSVWHIRGDGTMQSYAEVTVETAKLRTYNSQLMLFGENKENRWRSIRSVLQKEKPQNSSRH